MNWIDEATRPVYDKLMAAGREKLAKMYRMCFASTWDTTLQRADGTVFLITGDIPAMWLRDSSAQVFHYIPFANDFDEVRDAISGLIKRQMFYIVLDPYSNAFNKEANNNRLDDDRTSWTPEQKPWIWERKYEIDSLCYPVRLCHAFWKKTGDTSWCDETVRKAFKAILDTWETEQRHMECSPYYFERSNCPPSDTLPHDGKGNPVGYTGMTWSGFRPSDDACKYGYLIPSNFFAAKSLEQIAELSSELLGDETLAARAKELRDEIIGGIKKYSTVEHPDYGKVFAYEVDGLGNYHLMDDANVPSLLSLPYLGCVDADDAVYQNTRKMLLSCANPYYFEGEQAKGIGSPHTPKDYIWPISLCIQGLTSNDKTEIVELINTLENIDADTCLMHEGVHKDDCSKYTRPWFAWANSIFSEFAEKAAEYIS